MLVKSKIMCQWSESGFKRGENDIAFKFSFVVISSISFGNVKKRFKYERLKELDYVNFRVILFKINLIYFTHFN